MLPCKKDFRKTFSKILYKTLESFTNSLLKHLVLDNHSLLQLGHIFHLSDLNE